LRPRGSGDTIEVCYPFDTSWDHTSWRTRRSMNRFLRAMRLERCLRPSIPTLLIWRSEVLPCLSHLSLIEGSNVILKVIVSIMPQASTITSVKLWKVGSAFSQDLVLTAQDVSAHLLSDWLPGVPAGQGADFMGWPRRLLSSQFGQLCLSDLVARTERQWKGMVSWMLGVAGARAYLTNDGYRWIAPISAFFEDAVQPVSVPNWYLPTISRARSDRRSPENASSVSRLHCSEIKCGCLRDRMGSSGSQRYQEIDSRPHCLSAGLAESGPECPNHPQWLAASTSTPHSDRYAGESSGTGSFVTNEGVE